MGLGLLGRGINIVKFLSEMDADLIVTDLKNENLLKSALLSLRKYQKIKYVLGQHRLEDFAGRDMIIKAAGVPLDSVFIKTARENKIPIEMDASLFAKLTEATVIGVTGTRGKSTTASLIYTILKTAGKKVYLAGNIRGTATLPLLKKAKKGDLVVLELDSWQLQGFGDSKLSPHISVFTNFMADHMNYYKGDMAAYFNDKTNIFRYQNKKDFLIIGPELAKTLRKLYKGKIESRKLVTSGTDIPKNWPLKLAGEHNRENISCAVKAVEVLGIASGVIKKAVIQFGGLPGRLEYLKNYRGVRIYNDTNSTTPDAVLAGLKALSVDKNAVLIMGGADKNLDMDRLIEELPNYCKEVVLLPGTGTDKIRAGVLELKGLDTALATGLKDAIEKSLGLAKRGDIILFSPGFASFGLFQNEYDRGEKFVNLVRRL